MPLHTTLKLLLAALLAFSAFAARADTRVAEAAAAPRIVDVHLDGPNNDLVVTWTLPADQTNAAFLMSPSGVVLAESNELRGPLRYRHGFEVNENKITTRRFEGVIREPGTYYLQLLTYVGPSGCSTSPKPAHLAFYCPSNVIEFEALPTRETEGTGAGTTGGTTATDGTAGGFFAAPPVYSSGATRFAQVVVPRSSLGRLEDAMRAVGARGVWAQAPDGSYALYVLGAPPTVNAAFMRIFPNDLPPNIALILVGQ